jgi:hypothetical protein
VNRLVATAMAVLAVMALCETARCDSQKDSVGFKLAVEIQRHNQEVSAKRAELARFKCEKLTVMISDSQENTIKRLAATTLVPSKCKMSDMDLLEKILDDIMKYECKILSLPANAGQQVSISLARALTELELSGKKPADKVTALIEMRNKQRRSPFSMLPVILKENMDSPDIVTRLESIYSGGDSMVRAYVLYAVSVAGYKSAMHFLLKGTGDQDIYVVLAAIYDMALVDELQAKRHIDNLIADSKLSSEDKSKAILVQQQIISGDAMHDKYFFMENPIKY